MEIQTNFGNNDDWGLQQDGDHECVFEVQNGFKILAFIGVIEAIENDCRMLNFSVMTKEIYEDNITAE
jgi:hypothetical protein